MVLPAEHDAAQGPLARVVVDGDTRVVEEAAPDATPMEAEAEPPVAQAEPEEEKATTARSTRSKRKLDAPAPTAASTRSKRTRAAELI